MVASPRTNKSAAKDRTNSGCGKERDKATTGLFSKVLYCPSNTRRLTVLGWAFSFVRTPSYAGKRLILRVPRRPREGAE